MIVNDMAATNIDGALIESVRRETVGQPPALVRSGCTFMRDGSYALGSFKTAACAAGLRRARAGNSLLAAIGTLMRAAEARGQVLMAMCAHACAGVRACALSILVGEFARMHLRARLRAGMGQHRHGVQV